MSASDNLSVIDLQSESWPSLISNIGLKTVNQVLDERMGQLFETLQQLASSTTRTTELVIRLKTKRGEWHPAKDQFERSVLHLAAWNGNTALVRGLVLAGANINEKDGIHQTPLTLALHNDHLNTAKFLIEHHASISSHYFQNTSSPLEIAKSRQFAPIVEMIDSRLLNEKLIRDFITTHLREDIGQGNDDHMEDEEQTTDRSSNFSRCLNINVGDQKNTVTIQACANRCPDQYGCHSPGAGDFHNRGYMNECIARFAGEGGFWHVTEKVLKRPTVNPKSFKDKFKENNYNNNEEALEDYEDGISIAMLRAFQESTLFPTEDELDQCYQSNKCHNDILCEKFEKWLAHIGKDHEANYQAKLANDILPLRRWYKESVRHGNGKAIEAVWMVCPAMYAQCGKYNYRDESFSHIVNFARKWPIAYRLMYRQNRTVNVDGRVGKQLGGDEWVEEHLVRPVKMYAKAQTSFSVLEMMSCSSNILEMNKKVYTDKEAFDIHRTRKHRTPSSLHDQLKVAQFALKEEWFLEKGRMSVKKYPWGDKKVKDGDAVTSKYIDPLTKGEKKAKEEFPSFLHRKYPNEMNEKT